MILYTKKTFKLPELNWSADLGRFKKGSLIEAFSIYQLLVEVTAYKYSSNKCCYGFIKKGRSGLENNYHEDIALGYRNVVQLLSLPYQTFISSIADIYF